MPRKKLPLRRWIRWKKRRLTSSSFSFMIIITIIIILNYSSQSSKMELEMDASGLPGPDTVCISKVSWLDGVFSSMENKLPKLTRCVKPGKLRVEMILNDSCGPGAWARWKSLKVVFRWLVAHMHTSYLSPRSPIYRWRKNWSYGEISDFNTQQMWRNQKFCQI